MRHGLFYGHERDAGVTDVWKSRGVSTHCFWTSRSTIVRRANMDKLVKRQNKREVVNRIDLLCLNQRFFHIFSMHLYALGKVHSTTTPSPP